MVMVIQGRAMPYAILLSIVVILLCSTVYGNQIQLKSGRASTTACDSQPCFRGYCQSINTNEYRCLCYNGYQGQLCNEAINASGLPCGSSPCTAGKCVNVRNETGIAYLCLCNSQNSTSSCVPEYSRCPSPCASNPCLNGQCSVINRGTTYACGCWPGYTGKNCESTAHWQSCSVYKGSFCAGHVNYLATKLNDANKYEKSLSLVYSFAQATGVMPYECLRFSKPYVCSSLYQQCYNGTSFNSMCQSDCLKYQTFRKNCFSGMIGSDKEFGLKSCSSIKQNNPPQCFHIQDPPSPDVIDYKECFVYSGNVCSGYLPSLNVTVAGNIAADLAEKDIKNSIDLLNTASNFSLTCREYISATLCHTTFKQCDDHSNLCKSDCYRMVKLFKTCASQIPGVQQSILYPYINCAKLSDDDCVSYNVPYPQPVDNKIRLVNGNNLTLSSGIVEIIKNDTWYRLCYHHGWNMVSAQVACKQLGYRGALSTGCCGSFPTQPYGGNPQLSVMASIYCTGEEKYIGACQFKRDQSATCDVRNSAGVICSNSVCVSKPCNYGSCVPNKQDNNAYTCKCDPGYTGQNCDKVLDNCRNNPCPVNTTCVRGIFGYKCVCKSGESCTDTANYNITARLVNHWEGKPYTGVLEFYYNGTWGPSCEVNAAAYHTACRSIGYKRAFATSCCSTGHYASSIRALDFILCNENAQNLYECSYGNYIHRICANHGGFWNTITCTNDACLAQPCGNHGQCVHKEFNNDYYCVCDKYFTGNNCEQALACASSPCQNGGNCTNDLTSYNCSCPSNYFGQNCDQLPACSSNPCITGTCVNFNNNTYQCQCSSKFTGQRCESGLACNSNPCLNGASCVINDVGDYQCGCMNGFTGKNCETHQYLFNGNVRLQGGSTSMDGYAEVYYNGSWRGICDDNFGLVDGQVICRQLGYVGAANIKCCSNFGTYNGKYWLTNVDCYGDESEISDCRHDPWGNVNCAANEAITVICTNNPCLSNKCNRNPCEITNATEPVQYKCTCTSAQSGKNCQLRNICQFNPCNSPQNCTDESYGYSCSCPNGYYGTSCTSRANEGDVRLVDKTSDRTGRIQIYHNGQWGSFCDHRFDAAAGNVLCRQLGIGIFHSYNTTGKTTQGEKIWVDNFKCKGNEINITQCDIRHWGTIICSPQKDVRLTCQEPPPTTPTPGATTQPVTCATFRSSTGHCAQYLNGSQVDLTNYQNLSSTEAMYGSIFTLLQSTGVMSVKCVLSILPALCKTSYGSCYQSQGVKTLCREDCALYEQVAFECTAAVIYQGGLGGQNCFSLPSRNPNNNQCVRLEGYLNSDILSKPQANYTAQCEMYRGSMCKNYLAGAKVYVPVGLTQEKIEAYLQVTQAQILTSSANGGTGSCFNQVWEHICYSAFPVCQGNVLYGICREDCTKFLASNCVRPYSANGINIRPDCSILPGINDVQFKCYSAITGYDHTIPTNQPTTIPVTIATTGIVTTPMAATTSSSGQSTNGATENGTSSSTNTTNGSASGTAGAATTMAATTMAATTATMFQPTTQSTSVGHPFNEQLFCYYVPEGEKLPCDSSPCSNNAECINTVTENFSSYYCKCKIGYFNGQRCVDEIPVKDISITANSSMPLSGSNLAFICEAYGRPAPVITWYKDGTIFQADNGNNVIILNQVVSDIRVRSVLILSPVKNSNGGNYWCTATIPPEIIQSSNITIDPNSCYSAPCMFGKCFDEYDGFQCVCDRGYTGVQCQSDIDECLNSPCVQGNCNNLAGSFNCSCNPGWKGKLCNASVPCYSNPCAYGTCKNLLNAYSCECTPGYTGINCAEDINECLPNLCVHGSCNNLVNMFNCSCTNGWKGRLCNNSIGCTSNPCLNGQCTDMTDGYTCNCTVGFTGIQCETDINECVSSPCNHGTCNNLVNKYNCSCEDRWSGDSCDISSGCDSNPCIRGFCLNDNTIGYRCICPSGYTGKQCDTDIDECLSGPCVNGVCNNLVGQYSCTCNSGWTGNLCGTDIDECKVGGFCSPDAVCTNLMGSYSCTCKDGFIGNGTYCRAPHLYPHGINLGDSFFGNSDDGIYKLTLQTDIYYMQAFHRDLYVSINGYVSIGTRYQTAYPRPFPAPTNISIIAPFFADADARGYTSSGILMHEYDTSDNSTTAQGILRRAKLDVANFQNYMQNNPSDTQYGVFNQSINGFVPTHVIVITWQDLLPSPNSYYVNLRTTNTFQLVLISNGKNLFGLFLYDIGGMLWYKVSISRPRSGYSYGIAPYFHETSYSGSTTMLRIDRYNGNYGQQSIWAYRLDNPKTPGINYDNLCRKWYNNEPPASYYTNFLARRPCPCIAGQASLDRRFVFNFTSFCATSLFSFPRGNLYGVKQRCCYSRAILSFGALLLGNPGGATFIFRNATQQAESDTAYQYCCVASNLCNLYYEKRPSNNCQGYRPPRRAWFWGDPHVRTVDGLTYTFNGLGEYTLLQTIDSNYFNLQGRTMKAIRNVTEKARATVFSAFALSQNDSNKVQATMNLAENDIDILVNSRTLIKLRNLPVNEFLPFENVQISRSLNGTLIVSFSSGISAEIAMLSQMLTVAMNLPNWIQGNTRGLLGTLNGNPSDDYLRPNGTYLRSNATESEIYYGFGQLYQITPQESLFTYPSGIGTANYTDPSFVPIFSENIQQLFGTNQQLYQQALQSCGNDISCLYDAALTLDLQAAVSGKDVATQYQETTTQLENFPPQITGITIYNVTFGTIFTTSIEVTDRNENDTVTVSLVNAPSGASFDNKTNVLTWNVQTYQNIVMEFVAVDSKGARSILRPQIIMCYCANGGTCDYRSGLIEEGSVNRVQCQCNSAYTGIRCLNDFNACSNFPCYGQTTCTDKPAPSSGYTCGPCPSSLTGDGQKCYDINICGSNSSLCHQLCLNGDGGYRCDCEIGYTLQQDNRTCKDINECSTVNTCGDAARCINTNGSYYCQCRINYNSTTITLQDTTRQTDQHCKVQAYNGRMTIDRPYSNQLADSNALQYQVLSLSVVQALSSSMNQNSLTRANYLDSVVESFTQTINGMTSCHYILILRATSNITVVQLNTVAGSVVRIGNYNVTQSSLSDYNECDNLTPCGQSEICNNTIGSYKCNCIAGYARNSSNGLCQANCPRSYCLNQGQCYYNNGKMACSCTASYTGDRCQNVRLSVVAIIGISLGSVVGVITIIALVAFAIKKCRSEKTAHITDDQDGKNTENMFMSSVLVGGTINRNYKNDDEKENEYEAVEPMI